MSNIAKLFGSFEDEDNPAHVDWRAEISKEDPKLKPGQPNLCLGNGEHPGIECCCDECDYFLRCFSEWQKF